MAAGLSFKEGSLIRIQSVGGRVATAMVCLTKDSDSFTVKSRFDSLYSTLIKNMDDMDPQDRQKVEDTLGYIQTVVESPTVKGLKISEAPSFVVYLLAKMMAVTMVLDGGIQSLNQSYYECPLLAWVAAATPIWNQEIDSDTVRYLAKDLPNE